MSSHPAKDTIVQQNQANWHAISVAKVFADLASSKDGLGADSNWQIPRHPEPRRHRRPRQSQSPARQGLVQMRSKQDDRNMV